MILEVSKYHFAKAHENEKKLFFAKRILSDGFFREW